ncbi:hypothetical protein [Streptomyces sp. NPDC002889]|uniref:hypothetical protein n=1 Tax=Streptomyces sp. NPDC002889 TaxID=3364669 RepID=UPI0036B5CCC6
MIRNVIGSILALAGATAAVRSPFRDWYDGRPGRDYRIQDLFDGITGADAGLAGSVLLPMAFAALVTLVGVALRSRLLVALAGLTVLGFTVLWMVRQAQVAGSLTVGGDGAHLGVGVAYALGGGVLLLVAAVVMSGRRGRVESYDEEPHPYVPPYGQEPYGRTEQTQPYGQHPPYEPPPPYGQPPPFDPYGPEGPPTLPIPDRPDER